MIFTPEQENIIKKGVYHINYGSDILYEFSGIAGGGKSTIAKEIIRRSNLNISEVAGCALTGAASIVLRQKGIFNSSTIHSLLYEPYEDICYDKEGKPIMNTYLNKPRTVIKFRPKPLYGVKLILVDEASMVEEDMAKEILSRGIKVIAMGDNNQLPVISGKQGFLLNPYVDTLTRPMRQKNGSAIIYIAQRAMMGLPIQKGLYGNDVLVIDHDELTDEMVLNADIVLTPKNSTREYVNNRVRHELLRIPTELPIFGEKVICKKNNWMLECDGINLVNGLSGIVTNVSSITDGKTFNMSFKPNMLANQFENLICDYKYLIAPIKMKQEIKKDRWSIGEKFEFGYASTVHSYQGSQAPYVIYIEEYMGDIQNRLNYTAITRASRGLIYVRQKRKVYY